MGFSTSFGITFLVMMVVLGTVCFLSYFRLSRPEEGWEVLRALLPHFHRGRS